MSSKLPKSDRTKLKFAQSNINHVYKGNTAETQHKPALRQYGMQVVGKLQGTRRMPPPAWVPSLKAETGGLDPRVALVPPGGGGWGSSSIGEQIPTQGDTTKVMETSNAVHNALSSINGSLGFDSIGTSFEPAYARSKFGHTSISCDPITDGGGVLETSLPIKRTPSMEQESDVNRIDSTTLSNHCKMELTPKPTWGSQPSGGLAANKPFFQRPQPVTTSVVSTQSNAVTDQSPSMTNGGARDVLSEPGSWATAGGQEPDFDEQLLFSEDEDAGVDSESCINRIPFSHSDEPNTQSALSTTTLHSNRVPHSLDGPRTSKIPSVSSVQPSVTLYTDRPTSDFWHATDQGLDLRLPSEHPNVPPVPTSQINERLTDGINHFANSSFKDFFHRLTMNTCASGLSDSALQPCDVDSELQHALRQARTQEFKSAVERAKQARSARQKSDVYNIEGDHLIQRSVVDLLSDSTDKKSTSYTHGMPNAPYSNTTLQSATQNTPHLSSLESILPPHLLSVYHQALASGQNRSDISAVMAAARAVALACSRSGGSSVLRHTSVPSNQVSNAFPSNSAAISSAWQNRFTTPTTIGMYSSRPPVPQSSQPPITINTPSLAPGTAPPNTVLLNPDYFVERFLELLNHPTALPSKEMFLAKASHVESASVDDNVPVVQNAKPLLVGESNDSLNPEVDELSSGLESVLKSEKIDGTAYAKLNESMDNNDTTKRVPGLMEVKVSTTSRNLAMLWEQDDYLTTGVIRGGRGGRSKPYQYERMRGSGRGRRPVDRIPNETSRSEAKTSDVDCLYNHSRGDQISSRSRHLPLSKSVSDPRTTDNSRIESEEVQNAHEDVNEHLPPPDSGSDLRVSDVVHSSTRNVSDRQVGGEGFKGKRQAFVTIPRQPSVYKSSHQEYDMDTSNPDNYQHNENGRRGHGSRNFHYGIRSYHTDIDGGNRRGYKESVYYTKNVRGSFTTRGRRGSSHLDFRDRKEQDEHDGRTPHLYPSARHSNKGGSVIHGDDNQTNISDVYDTYPRSNADRHREGYRKPRDYSSTIQFNNAEQPTNEKHSLRGRNQPPNSRSYRILEKHATDDKDMEEAPSISQTNPDEESDIPTVRVPAADHSLQHRSHYSSRGGRTAYFRGFRRPPLTRGAHSSQQQKHPTKRSTCASVPGSRRLREYRDRDGRDGEGGASMGGSGSSRFAGTDQSTARTERNSHLSGYNSQGGGGGDNGQNPNDAHDSINASHTKSNDTTGSNQPVIGYNHNNVDYKHPTRRFSSNTGGTTGRVGYRGGMMPVGGRYVANQSCHKANYERSYPHGSSKAPFVAIAQIPPLMSIKLEGPFTRGSQEVESPLNGKITSTEQNAVSTDPKVEQNLEDEQNRIHLSPKEYNPDSDDSSPHLDGFTKFVSKTSRKFARRRMQQLAADKNPHRHPCDTKGISDTKTENGINTRYSNVKSAHRKVQSLPMKPSFMGPPIHISDATPTSVIVAGHDRPTKAWIAPTSVRTSITFSAAVSNSTTARTWSKVVGSKSSPTIANKSDTDVSSQSTVSTNCVLSSSTLTTASDPIVSTSQPLTTALSVSNDYKVVQQIWSTVDTANASETETTKLTEILTTTTPSSLIELGPSTLSSTSVSNNICKVRPQQQQQPKSICTTTTTVMSTSICTSDHLGAEVIVTSVASHGDANPITSSSELDGSRVQLGRNFPTSSSMINNELPSDWVDVAASTTVSNLPHTIRPTTTVFPSNPWPPTDHVVNSTNSRVSSCMADDASFNQFYAPMQSSDAPYNMLTNSIGEPVNKLHPSTFSTRGQSYTGAPYATPLTGTAPDMSNFGLYGDISKLGAHFPPVSQHSTGFTNVAASGQLFMTSQPQTSVAGPHSAQTYSPAWPVHPSQNHPPQRYRQRLAQLEPPYTGFTFQPDLQPEYTFLPNATACIPPTATGLFSTVQASHSQSTYHPTSNKPTAGHIPATDSWCTSDFMASIPDYGTNTLASATSNNGIGEGLLPHPLPQGGYNAHLPGSLLPISSVPNSTYVGVIGGGRPTDLTNNARRGGLAQAIYQSQNLSHTQTANGQTIGLSPSLHMPSAFYHSLSPSHQRVHLQQYAASQNRANIAPGYLNPHTGLYAPHFAAPHPSNQATPPPLQSHAYSYGHRPGHNSRNQLGGMANPGSSAVFIPGGPSSLSGYPQPSAHLSAYPLKTVLPSI